MLVERYINGRKTKFLGNLNDIVTFVPGLEDLPDEGIANVIRNAQLSEGLQERLKNGSIKFNLTPQILSEYKDLKNYK